MGPDNQSFTPGKIEMQDVFIGINENVPLTLHIKRKEAVSFKPKNGTSFKGRNIIGRKINEWW
jgi:hypothetical protein